MCFSKHKPGFHPKPVHVGLMLGKVAMGKFCSKYFLFSTSSIIPPMSHAPSPALYSLSKWHCHWITHLKIHSNLFLYIHVIIANFLNSFFYFSFVHNMHHNPPALLLIYVYISLCVYIHGFFPGEMLTVLMKQNRWTYFNYYPSLKSEGCQYCTCSVPLCSDSLLFNILGMWTC